MSVTPRTSSTTTSFALRSRHSAAARWARDAGAGAVGAVIRGSRVRLRMVWRSVGQRLASTRTRSGAQVHRSPKHNARASPPKRESAAQKWAAMTSRPGRTVRPGRLVNSSNLPRAYCLPAACCFVLLLDDPDLDLWLHIGVQSDWHAIDAECLDGLMEIDLALLDHVETLSVQL